MGRRLVFLSAALLTLFPVMAVYAHERFIRHDLKVPVHEQYFARQPNMLLGMQSDMLRIATVSCVLLLVFLVIFFFRQNLDVFIEQRLLSVGLRGAAQRALHHLANFLTDKPVRLPAFRTIGEWAV